MSDERYIDMFDDMENLGHITRESVKPINLYINYGQTFMDNPNIKNEEIISPKFKNGDPCHSAIVSDDISKAVSIAQKEIEQVIEKSDRKNQVYQMVVTTNPEEWEKMQRDLKSLALFTVGSVEGKSFYDFSRDIFERVEAICASHYSTGAATSLYIDVRGEEENLGDAWSDLQFLAWLQQMFERATASQIAITIISDSIPDLLLYLTRWHEAPDKHVGGWGPLKKVISVGLKHMLEKDDYKQLYIEVAKLFMVSNLDQLNKILSNVPDGTALITQRGKHARFILE